VVIFEHAQLYNLEGELADPPPAVDIEQRRRAPCRPRRDHRHLRRQPAARAAAADELAGDGIEAEVIDLRVLRPLDWDTVVASVRRTHRLVVVDEGWRTCSLAAEIMAGIGEQAFYDLDAPPARVCTEEVPIPYAKHMEEAALPMPPKIVAAVRQVCGKAQP
jgi:pyruvate dehydrogenase E1 component beta subunit